jgi:uncharacterized protein (DUF1697 family)
MARYPVILSPRMSVIICMLRGVNVGGHNRVKMDELRALCAALKLRDAQSYVQSGNVIFRSDAADPGKLSKRIADAIEKKFKFRCDVVCRTSSELKAVVAKNPFAKRKNINPGKLLVTFLSGDPGEEARAKIRMVKLDPEELWIDGRECFVYFPDGMGRSKFSWPTIGKMLGVTGTGRNWNSVLAMLEIAEKMEGDQ